jgi:hypothetical protein
MEDKELDCADAQGAEGLPVQGIEPARTEGGEFMIQPEPPGDDLPLQEKGEVPVAAG